MEFQNLIDDLKRIVEERKVKKSFKNSYTYFFLESFFKNIINPVEIFSFKDKSCLREYPNLKNFRKHFKLKIEPLDKK